jgi:hypothetical protein
MSSQSTLLSLVRPAALPPAFTTLSGATAVGEILRMDLTDRLRLERPALEGMGERLLDVTPLYAGVCAREIDRVVPAAEAVAPLDPG